MGSLFKKGSISARRYAVLGELPADYERRFVKGLRAHAFMAIDPASEADATHGWVEPLDDDDADVTAEKSWCQGASGLELRLALRSDVLKPPADEVRRQVAERAAAIQRDEGRKVGRRERATLKEEVVKSLRRRAFSRRTVVQAVWIVEAGRLYFASQSRSANERFLDLFAKSFGMKIEPEGAAWWAVGALDRAQLLRLEPTRELWLGFEGVRPLSSDSAQESA